MATVPNELDFGALLKREADETLLFRPAYDFTAATGGRLTSAGAQSWFGFMRDLLALYNTPRGTAAHIVIGITEKPGGRKERVGFTAHPDTDQLHKEMELRQYVHPVPVFTYHRVQHQAKSFGLVEIPPMREGPSLPLADLGGGTLERWRLYFRRGASTCVALEDDESRIREWFTATEYDDRLSALDLAEWQRLLAPDPRGMARHLVLVLGPRRGGLPAKAADLGRLPWSLVVDFDPRSDRDGVCAAVAGGLAARRSFHRVLLSDTVSYNPRAATYWVFARGVADRAETLDSGDWLSWQMSHARDLGRHFRAWATAASPWPVALMAVWEDASEIRFLESTLTAAAEALGASATSVLLTPDSGLVSKTVADFRIKPYEVSFAEFCAGLDVVGRDEPLEVTGDCLVPTLVETDGQSHVQLAPLPPPDQRWLEEELEIVHLGVGRSPPSTGMPPGREFLRGARISWYELALRFDVEREITARIRERVRKDLKDFETTRINLYHRPGAGASTIGRRILWDFHRDYPCLVLKRTVPKETFERLFHVRTRTRLPLLLLVEGATVTENASDELYAYLRSSRIPVVMLQVFRRLHPSQEGERVFPLSEELSPGEASEFAQTFASQAPAKAEEILSLAATAEPRFRSAFFFGLIAFGRDFLGLDSYLSLRLGGLQRLQSRVVESLAIAYRYAQRALPAQLFARLLGVPATHAVDLVRHLPELTLELLVEAEPGAWRATHDLIAESILEHLFWPHGADRRGWRQNLSTRAVEFATLCRSAGEVPSEDVLETVRRVFILRDSQDVLGTERSMQRHFSRLLDDIPSRDGQAHVLRSLTVLFPEEPHFWAHLGRYLSIVFRQYNEALGCMEQAIRLQPNDSVLHHMKGMTLGWRAQRLIIRQGELADILELTRLAAQSFARTRQLKPEGQHGYISEVQLIIKVLRYIAEKHDGLMEYFASAGSDPYARDCLDRAEDLLRQSLHLAPDHRDGSRYEQECRAQLDTLYGRYDQAIEVLGNLLGRGDVYAPPVRRQLVWTILAKHQRVFHAISRAEADRIIGLLEANIEAEPYHDTNLTLWMQAIRYGSAPPDLHRITEQMEYWATNTGALAAHFYLHVLHSIQVMDGADGHLDRALYHLERCRERTRDWRNKWYSWEWLGRGQGVEKLLSASQVQRDCGDRFSDESLAKVSSLDRVPGRVARIEGRTKGEVALPGGLRAHFVPAGRLSKARDENAQVSLVLGFSYDGIKGWAVQRQRPGATAGSAGSGTQPDAAAGSDAEGSQ